MREEEPQEATAPTTSTVPEVDPLTEFEAIKGPVTKFYYVRHMDLFLKHIGIEGEDLMERVRYFSKKQERIQNGRLAKSTSTCASTRLEPRRVRYLKALWLIIRSPSNYSAKVRMMSFF